MVHHISSVPNAAEEWLSNYNTTKPQKLNCRSLVERFTPRPRLIPRDNIYYNPMLPMEIKMKIVAAAYTVRQILAKFGPHKCLPPDCVIVDRIPFLSLKMILDFTEPVATDWHKIIKTNDPRIINYFAGRFPKEIKEYQLLNVAILNNCNKSVEALIAHGNKATPSAFIAAVSCGCYDLRIYKLLAAGKEQEIQQFMDNNPIILNPLLSANKKVLGYLLDNYRLNINNLNIMNFSNIHKKYIPRLFAAEFCNDPRSASTASLYNIIEVCSNDVVKEVYRIYTAKVQAMHVAGNLGAATSNNIMYLFTSAIKRDNLRLFKTLISVSLPGCLDEPVIYNTFEIAVAENAVRIVDFLLTLADPNPKAPDPIFAEYEYPILPRLIETIQSTFINSPNGYDARPSYYMPPRSVSIYKIYLQHGIKVNHTPPIINNLLNVELLEYLVRMHPPELVPAQSQRQLPVQTQRKSSALVIMPPITNVAESFQDIEISFSSLNDSTYERYLVIKKLCDMGYLLFDYTEVHLLGICLTVEDYELVSLILRFNPRFQNTLPQPAEALNTLPDCYLLNYQSFFLKLTKVFPAYISKNNKKYYVNKRVFQFIISNKLFDFFNYNYFNEFLLTNKDFAYTFIINNPEIHLYIRYFDNSLITCSVDEIKNLIAIACPSDTSSIMKINNLTIHQSPNENYSWGGAQPEYQFMVVNHTQDFSNATIELQSGTSALIRMFISKKVIRKLFSNGNEEMLKYILPRTYVRECYTFTGINLCNLSKDFIKWFIQYYASITDSLQRRRLSGIFTNNLGYIGLGQLEFISREITLAGVTEDFSNIWVNLTPSQIAIMSKGNLLKFHIVNAVQNLQYALTDELTGNYATTYYFTDLSR